MSEPGSGELQPSGLGPLGDVQLLASMLRSDREDVESYARVLTGALGDALPAGMVDIEYQRSMGDRLAGRPGRPIALTVRGDGRMLDLTQTRGGVQAVVRVVVRNVIISRKEVGVDEWLRQLAAELSAQAEHNAAARLALERLLGR
jgi:hypothetical protein